jgi:hypothetical protein
MILPLSESPNSLIDPILVNNYDIVRDSYVLLNFCSDHCPSIIEINFSVTRESHDDTLAFGGLYKHTNKNFLLSAKFSKQTDSTSGTSRSSLRLPSSS